MTSLVLGAAGAVIGGYFGGPAGASLGWAAGSALGNALDPPKSQGPRLTNLKLQGGGYGNMIPFLYGTKRMAGQVIWQTDLREHSHTDNGKGGPEVTTFTYSASFAIKLCKGPVVTVLRGWADNRLVYDTLDNTNQIDNPIRFTLYRGVETAEPDPTMEAELGVGEVPAFRDDCVIVFTDPLLTDYGNRIPNFEFEVVQLAGPIPWRVSTFTPVSYAGINPGYVTGASYRDAILSVAAWTPGLGPTYEMQPYDIYGTPGAFNTAQLVAVVTTDPMYPQSWAPCVNDPRFAFGTVNGAGNSDVGSWYVNGVLRGTGVGGGDDYVAISTTGGTSSLVFKPDLTIPTDGALYGIGADMVGSPTAMIRKFIVLDGLPGVGSTVSFNFSGVYGRNSGTGQQMSVALGDDGFIYVGNGDPSMLSTDYALMKLDSEDLSFVRGWTKADMPLSWKGEFTFTIYQNLLLWSALDEVADGGTGNHAAIAYNLTDSGSLTRVGSIPALNGNCVALGQGLALVGDGVVSINPPSATTTLGAIVADLTLKSDSTLNYDVSDLTDIVHGWAIDAQGQTRSHIEPLQSVYCFDGVESDCQIKFVRRGHDPIATFDDDDLAAYSYGGGPPPILEPRRSQEVDLPRFVSFNYQNLDADYQPGSQHAERQTTRSDLTTSFSVALAMSDDEAKQVALRALFTQWSERNRYTFFGYRKHALYEPTDVVIVQDRSIRIVNKTESGGIIKFEGVESLAFVYAQAAVAGVSEGFVPTTTRVTEDTQLLLLDIPLVHDVDTVGFYAAMAPAGANSWRGASLMKSIDGGTNYSAVANASSAATMGVTSTALPAFYGGNIFDELDSVTVVIGGGGGELAGATSDAVLNGANIGLAGNELFQWKNAELVAADTYTLSGLLRGRRGTEWAMYSHHIGERFVLMDSAVVNVPMALSEFGLARDYKPVSAGATLSGAAPQNFTNTGICVQPYSPVLVGGGPDTSGNVSITWVRRTRIGGAWRDLVDVPLSEASEGYVAQIWNADFTLCARVITGLTSPACTYTAAQQVTDFGATQQHIYVTVAQTGSYSLGRQASATIPGSGASDSAPLAPVTPYGYVPPSGGAVCANPVTTSDAGSTHTTVYNTSFAPGRDWVVKFTTPSLRAGAGRVVIAEWMGDVAMRHGTLSIEPCGTPFGAGCVIDATTLGFWFYLQDNPAPGSYPTLAPSTAYYITVSTDVASGAFAEYSPPT